jgi:hypothetical protein
VGWVNNIEFLPAMRQPSVAAGGCGRELIVVCSERRMWTCNGRSHLEHRAGAGWLPSPDAALGAGVVHTAGGPLAVGLTCRPPAGGARLAAAAGIPPVTCIPEACTMSAAPDGGSTTDVQIGVRAQAERAAHDPPPPGWRGGGPQPAPPATTTLAVPRPCRGVAIVAMGARARVPRQAYDAAWWWRRRARCLPAGQPVARSAFGRWEVAAAVRIGVRAACTPGARGPGVHRPGDRAMRAGPQPRCLLDARLRQLRRWQATPPDTRMGW